MKTTNNIPAVAEKTKKELESLKLRGIEIESAEVEITIVEDNVRTKVNFVIKLGNDQ